MNPGFENLIEEITAIGQDRHSSSLLEHAAANLPFATKSIRELPRTTGDKARSGILISAGPSVHRRKSIRRIIDSGYAGTIVAVDGAYLACLREGLIPDYVMTLDPHPKRIVRWFGDPDFEKNSDGDDYFARQDLDVEFRKNSIAQNQRNIETVDRFGKLGTKALVASSAPANIVARLRSIGMEMYWWNPLVDDPASPDSLTRRLHRINRLPCLNTGGNVGSAAWAFMASTLRLPKVAMVGVDLGYYYDTPIEMTQTYYELVLHLKGTDRLKDYFPEFVFPLTGERFYTDPTYYWYRKNLLQMMEQSQSETYNCTEGGTLFGDSIRCVTLDEFLKGARDGQDPVH